MAPVRSTKEDEQIFTGEWLRIASNSEKTMELAHLDGNLLIWYQLDLSSMKPLLDEHVRKAVAHLYRKVPSLSTCFGTRGEELWFRRATNPEIDFEVHQGLKLEEVREIIRNYSYKSEIGPLFCAHLVRDSPDISNDTNDLEPSYPFKSHIIFGLHHGMTDGTSNMNIMGFFIGLLNDVISNKPINDNEPLGHFSSGEETMKLIMEQKSVLERDPKLRKKIKDDLHFQNSYLPYIVKGFPSSDKEMNTASFIRVIDQDSTSKFIKRCKQEKVTVSSVFTAVVNMALVDVLTEYGNNKNSYIIENFHTVNFRRFWEPRPSVPLGLHMGYPLMLFSETPKNVRQKFWEYAKTIGDDIKGCLYSGRILADKAYSLCFSKDIPDSDDHIACDYITSNMGDVTPLVTEGGDHVRITNIVRGSTFHKVPYPVLVNSHTFRGVFSVILDFNEALLHPDVAEKLCSQIVKCFEEIAFEL